MLRHRSRLFLVGTVLAVAASLGIPAVLADPLTNDPIVQVSGASPLGACLGDQAGSGVNYPDSEVEPWLTVNPADSGNLIGAWQQDRWDNGGSKGLVSASSFDGGHTWTLNPNTKSSICTGGTAVNGGNYERASDPWVDVSPDGTAYLMSLSVDTNPGGFGTYPNAMLVSRSTNGGATWEDPVTLRRDTNPNVLNDKNTLTTDPNDSDFVYAIWDRLVSPPGEAAPPNAFENSVAFQGPVWFSRTTDGGDTWEEAREIFDPGTIAQTIGNQIVVLPDNTEFDGELVDFFDLIRNSNRHKTRGFSIALIRSTDNGSTWDRRPTIVDRHLQGVVLDPDDNAPVRTGDILPEPAVDPNSGALYVVWQDARFGPRSSVAFSQSLDGGLTWSPTIKINQTPTTEPLGDQQAFLPTPRVLDDGSIGVIYYDFRNNTSDEGATTPTDVFVAHCHPDMEDCSQASSWGDEIRLTNASFDLRTMPVARGFFPGDYVGLDTDGTDFLSFWSMSHAGDPASAFFRRSGP